MEAFAYLRDREDVCGVGLPETHWFFTGGYTYLHRDVPIVIPIYQTELLPFAYNYALASPGTLPDGLVFSSVRCWEGVNICVYRRDGPCERAQGMEAKKY